MTFKFLSLASTGTEPLKSADIRSHRAVRRRDAGRETPPPPFRAVINKSESRLTKSLQWSGEQFIGSLISGIRERRQQQRQQQQKYQICDVSLFFFCFFRCHFPFLFFFTSFTSDSAIAIRFEQLRRRRRRLWKLRKPKKKNDNKEKGEGKKWIEKNDNEKKNRNHRTTKRRPVRVPFHRNAPLALSLSLSLSFYRGFPVGIVHSSLHHGVASNSFFFLYFLVLCLKQKAATESARGSLRELAVFVFCPRSLVSLLFLFCFCFCFPQWLICRRRCRIDFEIAFAATTTTEPYDHHRRTETRNWDSYFDYRRRIDYRLKRLD